MALQLGALRDALIEAGASEDKARKASEEIAGYEGRLAAMDNKLERLAGDVTLLKWMGSTNTAMLVAVVFKIFY